MYNHNKAQQSKTVCIYLGIYCTWLKQCTRYDNNLFVAITQSILIMVLNSIIAYCNIYCLVYAPFFSILFCDYLCLPVVNLPAGCPSRASILNRYPLRMPSDVRFISNSKRHWLIDVFLTTMLIYVDINNHTMVLNMRLVSDRLTNHRLKYW